MVEKTVGSYAGSFFVIYWGHGVSNMLPISDAHCDYLSKIVKGEEKTDISKETLRHTAIQIFAIWENWSKCPNKRSAIEAQVNVFHQLNLPNTMKILALEGMDVVEDNLNTVYWLIRQGIKIFGLTWNGANSLAGGCHEDGRLTLLGKKAVAIIEKYRGIVDTAHLNEQSFYDVLETAAKPVLCSHSNCYALCLHPRNLKDEQIKLLLARNGLMGICFYPPFLKIANQVTSRDIAEHIDYVCQMAGNSSHVCFGSDFDGIDRYPSDVNSPLDVPAICRALSRKGYEKKDILQICYGNLCNFVLK